MPEVGNQRPALNPILFWFIYFVHRPLAVQRPGVRDQGSPVKFAPLVFFEEFNGASKESGVRCPRSNSLRSFSLKNLTGQAGTRCQVPEVGSQRSEVRRRRTTRNMPCGQEVYFVIAWRKLTKNTLCYCRTESE